MVEMLEELWKENWDAGWEVGWKKGQAVVQAKVRAGALATVASGMIKNGLDFHIIENITGLSRQELQRLQHESQDANSV